MQASNSSSSEEGAGRHAIPALAPQWNPNWAFLQSEIIGKPGRADCLRMGFRTPRGEFIFEIHGLSEHEDFIGLDDDDEMEGKVLQHMDFDGMERLEPGRYYLRWVDQTWQPEFDTEGLIEPLENVVMVQEVEPAELSHLRKARLFQERELVMESLEHGLGVARSCTGQRFFYKTVARKPKDDFMREVEALHRFEHPHIIRLTGFLTNANGKIIGLLTPFAARGTLDQQLDASDDQKLRWVSQVVQTLIYLRDEGYMYQDVKCSNVVIDDSGKALLVDFDGGYTPGKWLKGSPCFGVGVMIKDLQCRSDGVDDFIRSAKEDRVSLEDCLRILVAPHMGEGETGPL